MGKVLQFRTVHFPRVEGEHPSTGRVLDVVVHTESCPLNPNSGMMTTDGPVCLCRATPLSFRGGRTASGELPAEAVRPEHRLTGSLSDDSIPREELERRAAEVNPMRRLCRLVCLTCAHRWQQPAETGRCPKCGDSRTSLTDRDVTMALRV